MILTLSTTYRPATDLGYLLHKNPAHLQSFKTTFGRAHVFYPEVSEQRCSAALLLDVDPVGLVRGRGRQDGAEDQYVNDRPYVASSFMSVAIADLFGTAMNGRSKERPELAASAIPLEIDIDVLPCRGGDEFLRRLFEPLGYEVTSEQYPLDEVFPEWGMSRYFRVNLKAEKRLADVLSHLYVLIPVMDDDKHYWVGSDEVEKLLRKGAGWLGDHPEKELISSRYLAHKRSLAQIALERLLVDEPEADDREEAHNKEEEQVEERISLNQQRMGSVLAALKACNAHRVLDLGCGEGSLLRLLLQERQFERIVGMDVSHRALEIAARRLRLERMPPMQRERLELIQGSLIYRDERLSGFDAAAVVEVVEHLDPPRLGSFERALFEAARPAHVVLTTPNAEYNVRFPTLPAGKLRHKDHRFEWTRGQFESWSASVADRFGYAVRFVPVGPVDHEVGPPTQMAVFSR